MENASPPQLLSHAVCLDWDQALAAVEQELSVSQDDGLLRWLHKFGPELKLLLGSSQQDQSALPLLERLNDLAKKLELPAQFAALSPEHLLNARFRRHGLPYVEDQSKVALILAHIAELKLAQSRGEIAFPKDGLNFYFLSDNPEILTLCLNFFRSPLVPGAGLPTKRLIPQDINLIFCQQIPLPASQPTELPTSKICKLANLKKIPRCQQQQFIPIDELDLPAPSSQENLTIAELTRKTLAAQPDPAYQSYARRYSILKSQAYTASESAVINIALMQEFKDKHAHELHTALQLALKLIDQNLPAAAELANMALQTLESGNYNYWEQILTASAKLCEDPERYQDIYAKLISKIDRLPSQPLTYHFVAAGPRQRLLGAWLFICGLALLVFSLISFAATCGASLALSLILSKIALGVLTTSCGILAGNGIYWGQKLFRPQKVTTKASYYMAKLLEAKTKPRSSDEFSSAPNFDTEQEQQSSNIDSDSDNYLSPHSGSSVSARKF